MKFSDLVKKPINESAPSMVDKIYDLFNSEMRVQEGPMSDVGYAQWSNEENGEPAVWLNPIGEIEINVQYLADSKGEAKSIVSTLEREIKYITGIDVKGKFSVERDIFGVEEPGEEWWYVEAEFEIDLNDIYEDLAKDIVKMWQLEKATFKNGVLDGRIPMNVWVLPQDTSGWVITKVLPDSVLKNIESHLKDIYDHHKISVRFDIHEKGFVSFTFDK